MSEELRDEVEAINSIYGDGCLAQQSPDDATKYVLTPPGHSCSLRLEFPPDYPDTPPMVIGTNSTGEHGRKGDAARELDLFRQAVSEVYQPGAVCLFDAIEELTRLLGDEAPVDERDDPSQPPAEPAAAAQDSASVPEELSMPDPPWIMSDPFVEMKSTFVARCARVSSPEEAESYVRHLLFTDKKVRAATHNMTAWRIRGPNSSSFQDCDDDGETAAGSRLLHLMQLIDLWDVMVVVTRWYGGQKLGPRRFALINQTARDAFVKAGLVTETSSGKKKGAGK